MKYNTNTNIKIHIQKNNLKIWENKKDLDSLIDIVDNNYNVRWILIIFNERVIDLKRQLRTVINKWAD